jgi:GntR family transcriptional repressor for pyruvate dehydrogenase complex
MTTKIIERPRLSHQVAGLLEADIVSGFFQEGDELPSERDLMARFKVGRPSIREALVILNRAGLVAVTNGVKAKVTRPNPDGLLEGLSSSVRVYLANPDGVHHFQHARLLLECALVRDAAANAKPEQIAQIEKALRRNLDALGTTNFEITDVEFHFSIAAVSTNPLFIGLHNAVGNWLREQRATVLRTKGQDQRAFDFHKQIFEGIAEHKPDKAEAAMRAHIASVNDEYWKAKARLDKKRARTELAVVRTGE